MDDLVDVICSRKASEPKDKAFATHTVLQKLLREPLPQPTYELPLAQIYQTLSLDLLGATGSMKAILAGSLCTYQNCPSWTADWSAEFLSYWLRPLLAYQNSKDAAFGSVAFCQLECNQRGILLVRGRKICTVQSCFAFRSTTHVFRDEEKENHVHNLDLMRQVCRAGSPEMQDLICSPGNHVSFPNDIDHLYLRAYWMLCRKFSWWGAAIMLDFLVGSAKIASVWWDTIVAFVIFRRLRFRRTPCSELLRAHIAICNSMSSTKRHLFLTHDMASRCSDPFHASNPKLCQRRARPLWYRLLRRHKRYGVRDWGVCTNDVQPGDEVILVAGLSMPLVVRRDGIYYRLVSPAIISNVMQGQAWPCNMTQNDEANLEYFRIM